MRSEQNGSTRESSYGGLEAPRVAAERLRQQAADADENFAFLEAFRLFALAAFAFIAAHMDNDANLCLMRAATSLEKTQDWRAHFAAWEFLGDRLGEMLSQTSRSDASGSAPPSEQPDEAATRRGHFDFRDKPGQSGMFPIASWDEWLDPHVGYYRNETERKRNQQAWAYYWAAQGAEVHQNHGHASYLYRKAAIAWELTTWGDRPPSEVSDLWSRERLQGVYGDKWRLAADCYFRAALNQAVRGRRPLPSYVPTDVGWGKDDASSTGKDVAIKADDIDRLLHCWEEHCKKRGSRVSMTEDAISQLTVLQSTFAQAGRRREARETYRRKQAVLLREIRRRRSAVYPFRWLYYQSTGSGSSVRRTLLSAAIIYGIVFPLIFLGSNWIVRTSLPETPIRFLDAVVFSVANAVTLNVADYAARAGWGVIFQTLEALSAYFAFGYLIWVLLRSFEE